MESLRALLEVRYHPHDYPVQGCWWLCRLLELPTWQRLVLRAAHLPVALAGILDGGMERDDFGGAVAQARLLRLRAALPIAFPALEGLLATNIALLAARFGLDAVERDLLQFRWVVDMHPPLYEAVHLHHAWTDSELTRTMAHVLRYPVARVNAALSPGSPLVDQQLVKRSPAMAASFAQKFSIPE